MSEEVKSSFAGVKPPPATLTSLVEIHALQVLIFTGRQPNPRTGKTEKNLDFAKHNIDMLEMLQEKTKGNLDEEEAGALEQYLHLARMAYVEAAEK